MPPSSWFCETRLRDLPPDCSIMMTCESCGRQREEAVRQLIDEARLGAMYLGLIEWAFSCSNFHCGGSVSFAIFSPVQMTVKSATILRRA